MQTVYDLFTGPVATYLLPIRIITKWNAVDRFSATVVRVQVKGCPRDTCENPRGLLEAISCGSSVEALQRLYGSSQMLLDCACVFFREVTLVSAVGTICRLLVVRTTGTPTLGLGQLSMERWCDCLATRGCRSGLQRH